MRFFSTLGNDCCYQMKYGFYILYTFFSAVYVTILLLCPEQYRKELAAMLLLTDPAMLGSFFIGGIWLLEKGEGLHGYLGILPLRPMEYILSKAMSLAIISTLSADVIVLFGLRDDTNYLVLSIGMFLSSMIFTTIGLVIASYARSVNHYLLLVAPLEIFVALPPVLAMFGMTHPALEVLPSIASWRIIRYSIGAADTAELWLFLILALWLVAVLLFARHRIPKALQTEGGIKA